MPHQERNRIVATDSPVLVLHTEIDSDTLEATLTDTGGELWVIERCLERLRMLLQRSRPSSVGELCMGAEAHAGLIEIGPGG